ncbi:hypothetical protein [Cupriavidus oxalaticus]|uniref:Uncharacterized protein n=1 Tax=Cupriavidus oxalaticus TaxID=96344 RepID=A0A5P3VHJ4_9BURK|nr:hypothetical protein [Cupriavidus oxalaticus]QEZ44721.1 hypothetical protein D2917_11065 [Cupriavidus oxalaticus]
MTDNAKEDVENKYVMPMPTIPRTDIPNDLTHEEKVERFHRVRAEELRSAPHLYRGIVERAYTGRSKAVALKAFCLQCSNYQRNEVADCRVYRCALWLVRPYQEKMPGNDANVAMACGVDDKREGACGGVAAPDIAD